MMKKKSIQNYAILAVIAIGAGWYFLSGTEKKEANIVYSSRAVDSGTISRKVSASGSVDAVTMVDVSTEVSGLVIEITADFNDEVKAGQALARIDPQVFQTQVTQGQAEVKVAEANIAVQKATISSNESNLAKLERDLSRNKRLFADGNVSESALDTTDLAVLEAKQTLAVAKAQLQSAEATLAIRQASLKKSQIDLSKTILRTPIDGIVINRSVEVGQTVAASLSAPEMFKIAQDLDTIEIEASIDEADIGNIKEGQAVSFTVDAYPNRQFDGSVTQVRLAADTTNSVVTYTVVISARNPGHVLLPGMTANVDIITGERKGVTRVMNNALRFRPKGVAADSSTGGGPGNMAAMVSNRVKQQLNLTDAQAKKLQEGLEPVVKEIQEQMRIPGAPSGPGQMFQKISRRTEELLEDIAGADVAQKYHQMQEERSKGRPSGGRRGADRGTPGTVWVLDENGAPVEKRVITGISDDDYTEILGGEIKPGDMVIISARTENRK